MYGDSKVSAFMDINKLKQRASKFTMPLQAKFAAFSEKAITVRSVHNLGKCQCTRDRSQLLATLDCTGNNYSTNIWQIKSSLIPCCIKKY